MRHPVVRKSKEARTIERTVLAELSDIFQPSNFLAALTRHETFLVHKDHAKSTNGAKV